MINLILFKRQSEFFDYFKDLEGNDALLIVTPNPVFSDFARRLNPSAQTFTIQKFLQNEFDTLLTQEELSQLAEHKLNKSKLLLYLGYLWKTVFPEEDIISFRKAYRFLTDLRSFTLSMDVFENALENEEENLKNAVLVFQKFMLDKNIFDEHKGYYELSERLREGKLAKEYITERKILFWGFDFFSPLQLDMLKSLAIRDEVYLGLFESVYDSAYSVDWTGWLDDKKTNIVRLETPELKLDKVNVITFPKNGLARSIKSLLKSEPALKHNYFLATRDFDYQKIQEIPENELLFRTQINLLETGLKKLKEESLLYLETAENNYLHFIEKNYQKAVLDQNFIELKTLSLLKASFTSLVELTQNENLNRFEVELLFDIIELDAPRNNLSPEMRNELQGEILPIKMLLKLKPQELNLICATKNYGSLMGKESFSDSLEKKLSSIGPIRRPSFIFNILNAQILESLDYENSYLFIENNLEKEDLAWSEIFATIKNKINKNFKEEKPIKKIATFPMLEMPQKLTKISATKLQTFLDCPRKYYLQYISKDRPDYRLDDEIGFNILGTIEHEVIHQYINTFNLYNLDSHLGLVEQITKKELNKNKIELELRDYKKTLVEVRDYTQDVIEALLLLKDKTGINLEIEKEISSQEEDILRTGSIDLFGKSSGIVFLFDFKRSDSSIPNLSEIKNLKKTQILFYRRALKNLNLLDETDKVAWGYINLSDLKESLIIANDEDLLNELSALNLFKKINLESKVLEGIDVSYQELEAQTIYDLERELCFLPNPSVPSVCDYCEINTICPKKGGV